VCLAGALAGGFFGNLGALLYGWPPITLSIGGWWGVFTGLVAGLVWCRVMFAAVRRDPSMRLRRSGAWIGMWVGVLSTVLLHALLIGLDPEHDFMPMIIGLPFGIIVGAGVGALCGTLCRVVPIVSDSPDDSKPEHDRKRG